MTCKWFMCAIKSFPFFRQPEIFIPSCNSKTSFQAESPPMKTKFLFPILTILLIATTQAAPLTEAQVHQYRTIMQQAGQDLQQNRAQAAFNKVKPLAEQGFADAQYILATLYEDGEGTEVNFQAARQWYEAASQNDNPQVAELAKQALGEMTQ